MSIVSASDFSDYLGFIQSDPAVKYKIESCISEYEENLLIDILTDEGYDEYIDIASTIDFTEFEGKIKDALKYLMYGEIVVELQKKMSVNGTIQTTLENATYIYDRKKYCQDHNKGVKLYNKVIDWLKTQSDILIYSSEYKEKINEFGI